MSSIKIVNVLLLYFISNNFLRDTLLSSHFANPLNIKKNSIWRPAIEVKQNKENYTVKVQLPGINKDDIEIEINPDDLRVDTYRASGAGGQHINKTSSAVRITHIPTNIVVSCQSERSRIQNRETAMRMLKSRLLDLKEKEHKEKIEDLQGEQKDIAWGSQIRSYVFCPYTMVKDHRTNYEVGNVEAVMNGEIDDFIESYLKYNIKSKEN